MKKISKMARALSFLCLVLSLFLLFSDNCKAQYNKDKELVEAIIGTTWIHAHEEDDKDITAYREEGYDFPPSRGRKGFRMEEDGTFLLYAIAPTDGIQIHKGHWETENETVYVTFPERKTPADSFSITVISLERGLLSVKEGEKPLPPTGQIVQPQRFEKEIKDNEEYFTVVSTGHFGLFLFRESAERGERGMQRWEFSTLDTALTPRWTKLYDIDFDYKLLGYAFDQDHIALLFRDGYSQKDDYVIINMEVLSGDTVHYMVKNLVPMTTLTHFETVGDVALIAGMINYRPTIVHYDFHTGKSKVIPGIYKGESEILELKVDQETRTFNVLIAEKTLDRLYTVTLMSFSEDGVLLQNTKLEPEKDKSLIFAGSTPFEEEEIMVTGTYAHKRSSYSRGIFIAKVGALGGQDIAYYSYADLDNFFNYMSARREARVMRKIERKKIKGKKAKFNYRMLVRDVIERGDNYIMIGEAFYPHYRNNSFYGAFGGPFPFSRDSNFLGYKFTHAIVICFNSRGEILWDNSFEINDVENYDLSEVVNVGIKEDKIILLYLYEGVIRSKIIKDGEILEGKSSDDIKLNSKDDVVKDTKDEYGDMDNWYDDYFYAYGIQKLKPKTGDPLFFGRKVFFINKIAYR